METTETEGFYREVFYDQTVHTTSGEIVTDRITIFEYWDNQGISITALNPITGNLRL